MVWALMLSSACLGRAQTNRHGPIFVVQEENDLVVRTDRHYTQGIRVSYVHSEGRLPPWLGAPFRVLPDIGGEDEPERVGFSIGQSIFTPGDISVAELLPHDRPYAGWLYGGLILQRRGALSRRWSGQESLEFHVGVVGPESLAEEAQTWIHEIRHFDLPQGWDNQLETEPGLAVRYQRSWRYATPRSAPEGLGLDVIPYFGSSLGNVDTSLRAGGTFRFGLNVPDDFGVQTIHSLSSPSGGWPEGSVRKGWGYYLFARAEGSWVLYTTFLDGNLWHDSHSVEKEPLTGEFQGGIVAVSRWIEVGLTYVYRTPEFRRQELDAGFGSLSAKVKF
jgi:hypothetical protein